MTRANRVLKDGKKRKPSEQFNEIRPFLIHSILENSIKALWSQILRKLIELNFAIGDVFLLWLALYLDLFTLVSLMKAKWDGRQVKKEKKNTSKDMSHIILN